MDDIPASSDISCITRRKPRSAVTRVSQVFTSLKESAMSRYRGAGPMSMLTDGAALLGRLLLALIFLLSGFQKLAGFEGTVAFMAAEGLPFPLLAAIVALIVECLGGVA